MDTNNTQLKRGNPVGDDIIFEDINPKSDSSAILHNDIPMNKIIERIWNAIDNKLSRNVNSVNGKTGVVILDAKDVGLDKVDNVSFADIKKWVIDQLSRATNHIQIVSFLTEVQEICNTGNKAYNGAAYYSDYGFTENTRPHIGYIYWDESNETLAYYDHEIRIPIKGDSSINYNPNGDGTFGVKISSKEKILKVNTNGTASEQGLYLDESKLGGGSLLYLEGMYGNGDPDDENAFLYCNEESAPEDSPYVIIKIDGKQVNERLKLRNTNINVGTFILCNFKDYRTIDENDDITIPEDLAADFMGRTPALGRVKTVPSETESIDYYEIDFFTLKQKPGWGLKTMYDHDFTPLIENPMLTPRLATQRKTLETDLNFSGLQIFQERKLDDQDVDVPIEHDWYTNDPPTLLFTPMGLIHRTREGIGIVTDGSMYIAPFAEYGYGSSTSDEGSYEEEGVTKYYGSSIIGNWDAQMPEEYKTLTEEYKKGVSNPMSAIGINLDKLLARPAYDSSKDGHGANYVAANISGLRISKGDFNPVNVRSGCDNYEWYGARYGEPNFTSDNNIFYQYDGATGGLSVNVGKFLEIDPGMNVQDKTGVFYDGGKINVRIGKGLMGEPDELDSSNRKIKGNRIQVKIGKGIAFDDTAGETKDSLMVKIDPTRNDLDFDENGCLYIKNNIPGGTKSILRIEDYNHTTFDFNPTGADETVSANIETLTLGPGLMLRQSNND